MSRMTQPQLGSRSQVIRELFSELCPSDGQFTAVILDYFPAIHHQFSAGMSRTERLNMLLEGVQLEVIWQTLSTSYPAQCAPYSQLFALTAGSAVNDAGSRLPKRTATPGWKQLLATGAVCGTVALGWFMMPPFQSMPTHPTEPTQVALDTEPRGALVFDAETGEDLGPTPWRSAVRPSTTLTLCIQSFGYCNQLVEVKAGIQQKPIRLTLRAPATATQAECAEECHVPLTIVH